jgi:membrane-bound lytic murein transglycosylase D
MTRNWYKIIILGVSCALMNMALAASSVEGFQVYQKNLHLYPEHKQQLADDIYRYQNADNLWDALREEFALPHFEENPLVQEQIDWFMSHQEFLLHSATRAAPYLYYILQQVKKRHLPGEVALLPIIESAYNPFAYSSAGAAGIWQMMPGTASGYGVKQNGWYDGRRDVIVSTKAALNHLSYLRSFFDGNWLLAIAAYDTGEGSVLSAIRRNIRDGYTTEFWSLPFPQETRIYTPRLLALAAIISNPRQYPIYFPPIQNAPYLAQVDVGAQIDMKRAANLAGISIKKMWQLNPGYSQSATAQNGPSKLILPIENVEEFTENLARLPVFRQIRTTAYVYKVRPGDTLVAIARRFYINPMVLRRTNQLASNNIRPGTSLIIPRPDAKPGINADPAEGQPHYFTANTNTQEVKVSGKTYAAIKRTIALPTYVGGTLPSHYRMQSGDTIYMTRNNDTLVKVANRFHTSIKALEIINQLERNAQLAKGGKLVIPTHTIKMARLVSPTSKEYRLSSGDTVYLVKQGDNIDKIAKKYRTTAPAIRIANLMPNNAIHKGDRLIIPIRA